MSKTTYLSKGEIWFRLSKDGIETQIFDKEYYLNYWKKITPSNAKNVVEYKYNTEFTHRIYHLLSGEEFLNYVKEGYFIDSDGCIGDVFVNGYVSNLGLFTDNLSGGPFLVDENMWLDICKKYKVEVNWINK